ncbi:MAG TPA: hypothetical protein PLN86_09110 [Candidatus Hydrogenedentes bacterium]|nr:hypothetical protein [Candidatus Hydrogenedentota bacterium]
MQSQLNWLELWVFVCLVVITHRALNKVSLRLLVDNQDRDLVCICR